jgi:hypothetical protein
MQPLSIACSYVALPRVLSCCSLFALLKTLITPLLSVLPSPCVPPTTPLLPSSAHPRKILAAIHTLVHSIFSSSQPLAAIRRAIRERPPGCHCIRGRAHRWYTIRHTISHKPTLPLDLLPHSHADGHLCVCVLCVCPVCARVVRMLFNNPPLPRSPTISPHTRLPTLVVDALINGNPESSSFDAPATILTDIENLDVPSLSLRYLRAFDAMRVRTC